MTYIELDEFVAEYGFDNKVDAEGKTFEYAVNETERKHING